MAQFGHSVAVYEAAPHVGGLARSFPLWGQQVDLGPHRFFSKLDVVNALFFEVLGPDYESVDRLTRIFYRGKFYAYPLEAAESLIKLGIVESARCGFSYLATKLKPAREALSFEDWVADRFGRRLFQLFFKTYSEKVWGIPCSQIDADWAAQRIKKLSLYEAAKNALKLGGKGHVSLVDRFNYPTLGTGDIYTKMQAVIEKLGGTVCLSAPVQKITTTVDASGRRRATGIELKTGEIVPADEVISTMPITLMVQGLDATPDPVLLASHSLRYRNTILVYLRVEAADVFPDNWIYVHAPEVLHGRLTNFRNWPTSRALPGKTSIICMEFWCMDDDEIWTRSDADLGKLANAELRQVLGHSTDQPDWETHVVKLRRTYPIYEVGYREKLGPVVEHLKTIDALHPIGRYGAFKYNNQDHSILMGLLVAKKIDQAADIDLWSINTDSDYQEDGKA